MPNSPAIDPCTSNPPTIPHDAVYFVSQYPRPFEHVPARYVEPWWDSKLTLWPGRISRRKLIQEVTLLTVMRSDLRPIALYVVRVKLLSDHRICPESRQIACADMLQTMKRPSHEFSELWLHHILKIPKSWQTTLAVFLDEPIQNLDLLPLRVGGPLCTSSLAKISIDKAIDFMTRNELELPF